MKNEEKCVPKVVLGKGILGSQSNRNHIKTDGNLMILVCGFDVDIEGDADCTLFDHSEQVNIIGDVSKSCKMQDSG